MPKYQCPQFGLCAKANACEEFELTSDFKCPISDPRCREQLVTVGGGGGKGARLAMIGAPALIMVVAVGWWMLKPSNTISVESPQNNVEQALVEVWPWLKP